jgi:CBS domain-containing protein
MDATIQQLSRLMTDRKVTAALVINETSTVIGIVTDHDLRERVLTEEFRSGMPVYTIMSSPIIKIHETALVYEALMRMEENGVRHLAVESQDGDFVNIIDIKSLVQFQRYGPIVLSREISRAETIEEVAQYCQRTPSLVKSLLDSSSRQRNVTNMLSSVCDSASERLLKLGIEELGPPPVPFAFLGMGSHGRKEQTLFTDQDNGIIYTHSENIDPEKVKEYFLHLGNFVCGGLSKAGYANCIGQVMANNPRWCRSLPDWLHYFKEWINQPEPQEIININIFFDFRTVYGEESLSIALRQSVNEALIDQPAFMFLLAKNAVSFKPPFRILGNIYLGGGPGEHTGELNLKDAIMPIVSFARLYAFQHQINQTNTLDRIDELTAKGIFQKSTRDEITDAYDFLMQLRLKNQVEAYKTGQPFDNNILPARLSYGQQEMLKQALAQVAAVQKKINYDFMGGG